MKKPNERRDEDKLVSRCHYQQLYIKAPSPAPNKDQPLDL
jgi:hypothetical protein